MGKRFVAFIASAMIALYSYAQKPELIVSSDSVGADGIVSIPVSLKGASGICAFQFSVWMPDSLSPVTGTESIQPVVKGDLFTNHTLDYNMDEECDEGSMMNVVGFSPDNSVFSADSGLLCTINLKADYRTSADQVLGIGKIEFSTPDVESLGQEPLRLFVYISQGAIHDTIPVDTVPVFVPEVKFGLSPFEFNGALQSAIAIESNLDISAISFKVTVPENLAVNRLIRLFGYLVDTIFQTEIDQVDSCTYAVSITAIDDSLITAGVTRITGISVDFVIGLITPGIYLFSLDDISVTAADGTIYEIESQNYSINLNPNAVESAKPDVEGTVTYYTLDGRQVSAPVKGINLIRHPDGRITKFINR